MIVPSQVVADSAIVPVRELRIAVGGDRTGTRPLTWAQRLHWVDAEWIKPHEYHFNQLRVLTVPQGCGLERIVEVLGCLVNRYESLRTRYRVDPSSAPYQELAATEELALPVYRTSDADQDPQQAAEQLGTRFRMQRFETSRELPLRVAVLEHSGVPSRLVLVLCHQTMDFTGLRRLTRELSALLDGSIDIDQLPPVGNQFFDQVQAEAAPVMQRRSASALALWERLLRAAPLTVFDELPENEGAGGTDGGDNYGELLMRSPALTLAGRTLAWRLGLSGATVLMAAVSTALGSVTGRDEVPLKLVASNRGFPELRDFVGLALGNCAIMVPTKERSFVEVARDVDRAAFQAYYRAQYDPVALAALWAAVSAERGVERIELCCGLNDKRPARTGASTAAEIVALLPHTEITWAGDRPRQEVNLWYTAEERDGVDLHHALVNLRYLPRKRTEALFRKIEEVLVNAAVAG